MGDRVLMAATIAALVAAVGVALVADRPPRRVGRYWHYPTVVIATAVVNIGLTLLWPPGPRR